MGPGNNIEDLKNNNFYKKANEIMGQLWKYEIKI